MVGVVLCSDLKFFVICVHARLPDLVLRVLFIMIVFLCFWSSVCYLTAQTRLVYYDLNLMFAY